MINYLYKLIVMLKGAVAVLQISRRNSFRLRLSHLHAYVATVLCAACSAAQHSALMYACLAQEPRGCHSSTRT